MTIIVTPTVELDNTPPRIRLDVSASAGETSTTITRLDPDGTTVGVRTTDGNPLPLSGGGGLLYDYEAPFGQAVAYSSQQSPSTVSTQVTVDEEQVWLIHPGVPALSRPVTGAGITGRTRRVQRSVLYPAGRRNAWTASDGQRRSAEYTLTIRTTSVDDIDAINALLDDAQTLLLNVPAGKNWGIGAEYISVGDSEEDRLYGYAPEPRRHWQLPVTVVDRPEGGSQAQRTYVDLLDYPTYAALQAAYPTYTALLAGP